ncbi:MAG TPA: serine protease, partial [Leptospiraceae bacterium]|nr:serine protease [Leptospiraceae bacterium]
PYLNINSNETLDGDGELILDKDKAIGVLFRFTASKNSGKAIPGFLINTFIKQKFDKPTGTIFPFKGFRFRPLQDEATKEYFGLDKSMQGVLVAEILPYSTADNSLQLNDVILEYGGMKIDSQGYFKHPIYGKQYISFLAHCGEEFGFKMGKNIPVKILRNKKEETISMRLKPFPYKAIKIPYMNNEGKEPEYLIRGGFIFVELSEFLMKEFGSSWRSRIDKKLLYLNDYYRYHKKGEQGRYVMLVQVLPDDSNNGYHSLSFDIIKTVNESSLNSIRDLDKAISSDKERYVSLLTENGTEIVLDKTTLKEIDERIQKKFGIERLKNF